MRRFACLVVLAVVCPVLSTSGVAEADPSPGGFTSPNVSWVAHIPLDAPGVGARVVDVTDPLLGPRTRLYVTGSTGLSIYDVTDPAIPIPLGHLALPHWENEDVSVSEDGSRVIIAGDITGPGFVIDATVPQAPHIVSILANGEHTVTCGDPACDFIYGESGWIFDLRQPPYAIRMVDWLTELERQGGVEVTSGPHDLNRDEAGVFVSDTNPRLVFDLVDGDPLRPRLLALGNVPSEKRLAYQHNNLRPKAGHWTPRASGDTGTSLRAGELLLSNGETNTTIQCNGTSNGPFATWDMRNFDRGRELTVLDVYRPVDNGLYVDGQPAVNYLGCSGHWFTFNEGLDIAAAGWYEHGTRFLHVEEATGKISEVGYYQPVGGSTSAAHWIDDTYVYTVDYARGIDILRFDPDPALRPTATEIETSWLAGLDVTRNPFADAERYACRIAQS
jgi:hypothetical protein